MQIVPLNTDRAVIMSLPAAAVDLPAMTTPSIGAAVALGTLGLLATGFATLLYFRVVQGPGPTFLSLSVFIGLSLILCGIALSEIGPRISHAVQAACTRYLPSSLSRVAREDA